MAACTSAALHARDQTNDPTVCALTPAFADSRRRRRANSYNFEEPTLYALIFLLFAFTGPGPLSIDEVIAASFDDAD